MKRKKWQMVVLAAVLLSVVLWGWVHEKSKWQRPLEPPTSTASQTFKTQTPSVTIAPNKPRPEPVQLSPPGKDREEKMWNLGLMTPIEFYGRVIDDNGHPIEGAKASISIHNRAWQGGSKIDKLTDAEGRFSVSGHGLGLGVMVSKKGYYQLKESNGSFGYAQGTGTSPPHSDPNDPAIFLLRKVGQTEPIVMFERDFPIPNNGAPVRVDLASGRTQISSDETLQVEVWITDENITNPNADIPYDWRCRISVPGGGLTERRGTFDFEAPESGYRPADAIDMPASLGSKWRSQISRNYFVKLGDGKYARMDFTLTAGGEHFFSISSYLNPSGSRNLEYDPATAIKPGS